MQVTYFVCTASFIYNIYIHITNIHVGLQHALYAYIVQ